MQKLEVKIPASESQSYPIEIGSGFLDALRPRIEADFASSNKFIVTDENLVAAGHLQTLLGAGEAASYVISPAGEVSKNISTVVSIIEAMERASLGRDTVIVALGGGTVGDIAGFAAAVFKRGVGVIQIPTTPVSQADSSVGGKTGVDSSVSKNAFGAFWQPAAVYIDVDTLKTLPEREYRAGLVESVKHALIADAEYFTFFEKNMDAVLAREPAVLEKVALSNCRIKALVVEADPREKNQRRMLNYGHTIGHAVESASGYELLHGEAVAVGIVAAGMLEERLGLADSARNERIRGIFERLGVSVTAPESLTKSALVDIIKRDKKAVNKWPRFVLLEDIGKVHCEDGQWAVKVERELVEKVLDDLLRRE